MVETCALSDVAERIRGLAAAASLEMSTRDLKALGEARAYLRPGTAVNMTWLPKDTAEDRITAAVALRQAGLEPVPHIAARFIRSAAELKSLAEALAGQAGVRKAFVITGDSDRVAGPFPGAQTLLDTGILQGAGITSVGVTCYPEGHPRITNAQLAEALTGKLAWAARAGVEIGLVTQLCFDSGPILAAVEGVRQRGVTAPMRVGLAGPTNLASLIKFAARCGVGPSARALVQRPGALGQLILETAPDAVIRDLAEAPAFDALGDLGLHFFTFGGLTRTAKWIHSLAEGRFTVPERRAGLSIAA